MFIFSDETVLQVSRISNIALMLFTSEHKACFCRKERKNISGVVEIQYKVNVYILIPQIVGVFEICIPFRVFNTSSSQCQRERLSSYTVEYALEKQLPNVH